MHLHGGAIDPLGSEAVRDGLDLDVLHENRAEDGQMVFSLLAHHDPLHHAEPDVVFVVDAVAFEPAVELLESRWEVF